MLPAGTGGAEGVHPQIGRIDFDFDGVVDFRIDVEAGEGGVAAAGGIEGAFPHQAMHAGFRAQEAVGVVALDLDRGAANARHIAVGLLQQFRFEPLLFAVLEVLT